jgi:hypothetical protein
MEILLADRGRDHRAREGSAEGVIHYPENMCQSILSHMQYPSYKFLASSKALLALRRSGDTLPRIG